MFYCKGFLILFLIRGKKLCEAEPEEETETTVDKFDFDFDLEGVEGFLYIFIAETFVKGGLAGRAIPLEPSDNCSLKIE